MVIKKISRQKVSLHTIEREKEFRVSYMQEQMFFKDQEDENQLCINNISMTYKITGKLHIQALEESINVIINKYDSLRMVFREYQGEVKARIKNHDPQKITTVVLKDCENEESGLRKAIEDVRNIKFNLSSTSPIKFYLFVVSESIHYFVVIVHHIIFDGWSKSVFFNDLIYHYEKMIHSSHVNYKEAKHPILQYKDFVKEQRREENKLFKSQMEYWRKELSTAVEEINFPKSSTTFNKYEGDYIVLSVGRDSYSNLLEIGKKENVTLFTVLLACSFLLFKKQFQKKKMNIGIPVANRNELYTNNLIGYFANRVVIGADFTTIDDFPSLIKLVHHKCLNAYSNQEIPFEKVVELLSPNSHMGYAPFFQIAFLMVDGKVKKQAMVENTQFIEVNLSKSNISKFDLSLIVVEKEADIDIMLQFRKNIKLDVIMELKENLMKIINTVCKNSCTTIEKI